MQGRPFILDGRGMPGIPDSLLRNGDRGSAEDQKWDKNR
jgi:hypothetical protein